MTSEHQRPDVFNNLHGQLGKVAVTKALTTLVEKGEIAGKAYGKQWVYVARQDSLPAPSPEELDRLDAEIESLKGTVNTEREASRQLQAELGALQSSLTNEQIEAKIAELERDTVAAEGKLALLRSGVRRIDPEDKAKVDSSYERYAKEWRIRKRLCMDAVYLVTENHPKSPAEFMEELGMEVDPK